MIFLTIGPCTLGCMYEFARGPCKYYVRNNFLLTARCLYQCLIFSKPCRGEPLGFSVVFALLVVVYEALASILTCYRGWQALRIRVDLETTQKRLDYLVVKEGSLKFTFLSVLYSLYST